MNIDAVRRMRRRFSNDWLLRTRLFATSLQTAGHDRGGLLIVGTPHMEPWHLAAHLQEASALSGLPELTPTLVRHRVPAGAPAHLAVDLSRLHTATRHETVLVVAPDAVSTDLLSRVDDARRGGATILAIETGDLDLQGLARDTLTVPDCFADVPWPPEDDRGAAGVMTPGPSPAVFETAQHLMSLAAGERSTRRNGGTSFTDRLTRLHGASGPGRATEALAVRGNVDG